MLDSVEIKNFRSCEHVKIRLSEPVVALLGKNGAGKTNLLHALLLVSELCVGQAESGFILHPRDLSQPTSFALHFTIGGHRFSYSTKRSSVHSKLDVFEESLQRDQTVVFRRIGEQAELFGASELRTVRFGAKTPTIPALLQVLPKEHPITQTLLPVAEYLGSVRYYSLLQGFQEHGVGAAARQTFLEPPGDTSPFIEKSKYEAWKSELEISRPKRSVQMRLLHLSLKDPSAFNELKILLGEDGLNLLGDIRVDEVRIRPDKTEEGSDLAYALSFVPASGLAGAGRAFRYSGLSAGTWRVLQLLTYLIFDKNSCMLLEQPEDSVHPGLLAKVIDILRTYSGRTQLICTTHSPRVLNLVGPSGVRIVTATDGSTSVEELSSERLDQAKLYLQDEGTLAEYLETL